MQKKLELKPAFVERMKKILSGKDYEEYIKSLEKLPLKSIRCNTLKISPDELKERLQALGWKLSQPWKNFPEVFVVEGKLVSKNEAEEIERKLLNKGINVNIKKDNLTDAGKNTSNKLGEKYNALQNSITLIESERRNLTKSVSKQNQSASDSECILIDLEPGELGRALEHLLGYYYIQDLASMLPVLALEPKPKEIILDLCASPGSKTTQIASSMENQGSLIANEVSLGRIKILASNLERCGITNVVITRKDGIALCNKLKNQNFMFDKILIDAPCSGEGTLRSSPKTSIMWNPHTIKSLSKLQKSMLESALEILKPNGIIIYSTCTHAPEENEGVISKVLNENKNIILEPINLPIKFREGITEWLGEKYNPQVKKCARIYPHDTGTEGFFVAKIKKLK